MLSFKRVVRALLGAVVALAGISVVAGPVGVAQAQNVNWRVVANIRDSKQTTEKWKWFADELSKRTNGRMKLDVTTFPELGLTGSELIRLLNTGMLDSGEVITGYVSGEVPIVEGAQIVGVYPGLTEAKKAYEIWMDKVIKPNARQMGGVPIASFAFANMYLWTNFPVNSLADLKGKKIRIFAKAQADYLQQLGAEPVSIPLAEVYQALDRGVVDGVITGPDVANRIKLYEVAKHASDLMFGPGAGYVMVSQKAWNALPPDIKKEFEALIPEFQKRGWDLAFQENEEHLAAVKAKGVTANIPAKPEWVPQLRRIAQEVVVPAWAKRAGPKGVEAFNDGLGELVGFKIK